MDLPVTLFPPLSRLLFEVHEGYRDRELGVSLAWARTRPARRSQTTWMAAVLDRGAAFVPTADAVLASRKKAATPGALWPAHWSPARGRGRSLRSEVRRIASSRGVAASAGVLKDARRVVEALPVVMVRRVDLADHYLGAVVHRACLWAAVPVTKFNICNEYLTFEK